MYKSVGTLRCEIVEGASTFLFVPDSDHYVQQVAEDDCKRQCFAAFIKDGCSGILRPLRNGGVKLDADAYRDVALVAAARQVKVEIDVCEATPLKLTDIKERAW